MSTILRNLTFPALALTLFALPARAQSIGFGFSKQTKHGNFSFQLVSPTCAPHFAYPPREWTPGHFEARCEKVWIEGSETKVWVEPRFEWRYDNCGRAFQVCIAPGHMQTVCTPGHFEQRDVQVWIPGHWADRAY